MGRVVGGFEVGVELLDDREHVPPHHDEGGEGGVGGTHVTTFEILLMSVGVGHLPDEAVGAGLVELADHDDRVDLDDLLRTVDLHIFVEQAEGLTPAGEAPIVEFEGHRRAGHELGHEHGQNEFLEGGRDAVVVRSTRLHPDPFDDLGGTRLDDVELLLPPHRGYHEPAVVQEVAHHLIVGLGMHEAQAPEEGLHHDSAAGLAVEEHVSRPDTVEEGVEIVDVRAERHAAAALDGVELGVKNEHDLDAHQPEQVGERLHQHGVVERATHNDQNKTLLHLHCQNSLRRLMFLDPI